MPGPKYDIEEIHIPARTEYRVGQIRYSTRELAEEALRQLRYGGPKPPRTAKEKPEGQ